MVDLDEVQRGAFGDETRWKPIWVRFLGDWAGTADRLPTLKKIVAELPGVSLLHVSIFYPGTTLSQHRGPARVVHRYHYGLKIPEGDVGLNIDGHEVHWHEREGFVWDDTLPHSAWNHTDSPRIVIFADVFREFSPLTALGSNLMYSLVQRTKHVKEIKQRLAQEGINVD
jgi:beta-hydroxylase